MDLECPTAVALGDQHSCAVGDVASVWCWGRNDFHQLGLGDESFEDSSTPMQVTALGSDVFQLAAGGAHNCAVKSDGTLWCWGSNKDGELGHGVSIGVVGVAVEVAALGSDVAAFALGAQHSCAIKNDGSLWCWGSNEYGQVGDGSAEKRSTPVEVASLGSTVVQVELGLGHSCAVTSEGSLWCWGFNDFGQLGDGSTDDSPTPVQVTALGSDVSQIALGNVHTCAIKNDGTLWCWGSNIFSQLGDGSTEDRLLPVQVAALGNDVTKVVAGDSHSCTLRSDNSLWCWGLNFFGQLGDGSTEDRSIPIEVTALGPGVAGIALGHMHSCAIKDDNSLWCWGSNHRGQLGDGSSVEFETTPVEVATCPK